MIFSFTCWFHSISLQNRNCLLNTVKVCFKLFNTLLELSPPYVNSRLKSAHRILQDPSCFLFLFSGFEWLPLGHRVLLKPLIYCFLAFQSSLELEVVLATPSCRPSQSSYLCTEDQGTRSDHRGVMSEDTWVYPPKASQLNDRYKNSASRAGSADVNTFISWYEWLGWIFSSQWE